MQTKIILITLLAVSLIGSQLFME